MPNLDDELKGNTELRVSVKQVLTEALLRTRRSIGGRSLTREERRGLFATHLRTCITEHPKLYVAHNYYTTNRRSGRIIHRLGERCTHKTVCNHLMAPDIWFDAGMLRERLPAYLDSAVLRSIMENVMEDSETGDNVAKTSLAKLEGALTNLDMQLAESKLLNTHLQTEAKSLNTELSKL